MRSFWHIALAVAGLSWGCTAGSDTHDCSFTATSVGVDIVCSASAFICNSTLVEFQFEGGKRQIADCAEPSHGTCAAWSVPIAKPGKYTIEADAPDGERDSVTLDAQGCHVPSTVTLDLHP